MPASSLADLANDPDAEYIARDRPVAVLDCANPTDWMPRWKMPRAGTVAWRLW